MPSLKRTLSAVIAVIVVLAVPTVSVAHAYAHHEASEHVQPAALGAVGLAVDDNAIETAGHHGHGHPVVSPSVCNRVLQLLPALASRAASVTVESSLSPSASRVPPAPFESPPQTASILPAQPRAPPIL